MMPVAAWESCLMMQWFHRLRCMFNHQLNPELLPEACGEGAGGSGLWTFRAMKNEEDMNSEPLRWWTGRWPAPLAGISRWFDRSVPEPVGADVSPETLSLSRLCASDNAPLRFGSSKHCVRHLVWNLHEPPCGRSEVGREDEASWRSSALRSARVRGWGYRILASGAEVCLRQLLKDPMRPSTGRSDVYRDGLGHLAPKTFSS
jgi:hypothetical protein